MAPARTSNRRAPKQQPKQPRQRPSRAAHNAKENNTDQQQQQIQLLLNDPAAEPDPPPDSEHDPIFIDPVFGTPLAIYVEKDVENRDDILDTISKYGGTVSQAYSGVIYVLVDPYKESGQNLYRQYASKKNKVVLNAQWVYKCVAAGSLQGFIVSWAGCKVTGKEPVGNPPPDEGPSSLQQPMPAAPVHGTVPGAPPGPGTMVNASIAGPSNEIQVPVPNNGAPVHPGINPAQFYPAAVPPGLDPAAVYRQPQNAHPEYQSMHHYAMHVPVQDPSAHPMPPHDPTMQQQVAPPPMYAPPAQQPPAEPPTTLPTGRSTRARRSKRTQDAVAQPPLPSVQTVNGHPMPVTASSIDPLDPLAQAYEEQRRQQQEASARQEEEHRRRQEDDDRMRREEEERRHRDQGAQPQPTYNYTGYQTMHPEHPAIPDGPPQTWHAPSGISPQQTHLAAPPMYAAPHEYGLWPGPSAYRPPDGMIPPQPQAPAGPQPPPQPQAQPPSQQQAQPEYDYRYSRDVRPPWVEGAGYYPPQQQPYGSYYQQQQQQAPPPPPPPPPQPEAPLPEASPSQAEQSQPLGHATGAQPRGRRRQRAQPAPPASSLVANRHNPPARSPTPPSRVVKSTYGGNLFTSDDILYLKKYIDYVQEQGLVLSLREICERIAVKAPHHTFYSWRRYCNKHQIRLGGYHMDIDEEFPNHHEDDGPEPEQPDPRMQVDQAVGVPPVQATTSGVTPNIIAHAKRIAQADINRARSPTPPRALFRSTTGKGVAFTEEDVTFLVRFLEYRNRGHDGKVDMVLFWKEVFAKAPHHSRASWMKFYRRHKHELEHGEGDAPLPAKPEKKMRYSKADDALLAHFFVNKPEGLTSDKIFQEFARMHPHHPWKGWQEHHRIHKAKIDHMITKLQSGENIEEEGNED